MLSAMLLGGLGTLTHSMAATVGPPRSAALRSPHPLINSESIYSIRVTDSGLSLHIRGTVGLVSD